MAARRRRRSAPPTTNINTTTKTLGSAGRFSTPKALSTQSGHVKPRSGILTKDQMAASVTIRPTQAATTSCQPATFSLDVSGAPTPTPFVPSIKVLFLNQDVISLLVRNGRSGQRGRTPRGHSARGGQSAAQQRRRRPTHAAMRTSGRALTEAGCS